MKAVFIHDPDSLEYRISYFIMGIFFVFMLQSTERVPLWPWICAVNGNRGAARDLAPSDQTPAVGDTT